MISIYFRMCPPSQQPVWKKSLTPPRFQPNLHRIDQNSIKWTQDRQFLYWKINPESVLPDGGEKLKLDFAEHNFWPDRPVWAIFPPDIFPDQSARMTDIGFYQTESIPLAYKNLCVRGCTYKLKEFLGTFFKQIPTFWKPKLKKTLILYKVVFGYVCKQLIHVLPCIMKYNHLVILFSLLKKERTQKLYFIMHSRSCVR